MMKKICASFMLIVALSFAVSFAAPSNVPDSEIDSLNKFEAVEL